MRKRACAQRSQKRLFSWLLSLAGVGVVLAGVIGGAVFLHVQSGGAHAAGSRATDTHPVMMDRTAMQSSILPIEPMYKMAVKMGGSNTMPCLSSRTQPLCYSPQQIYRAYNILPLLRAGISGKGRVITIIDAFQDPTVRTDLHLFDRLFGLPDPRLNILAPFGVVQFNPNDPLQTGFAVEIALDVEWAHAIAPGATIDLVLANVQQETFQGELSALLQATTFAVQNDIGSAISQSFGASESCVGATVIQQEHQIFALARRQHQTVFASAGDTGAAVLQCDAQGNPVAVARGVNYPASDPLVAGVGGTTLLASRTGQYIQETVWNEALQGDGATGGGLSQVFTLPRFQRGTVGSATRAVGDISFDADPLTGVPVVSSEVIPGETVLIPIGGTSVGSPVMAGITALFDQITGGRLGFLNSALYRIIHSNVYRTELHDIQVGNNTFVFLQTNNQVVTVPGFQAVTGWDIPTGVGTPNVANLARLLFAFIKGNDGAGL